MTVTASPSPPSSPALDDLWLRTPDGLVAWLDVRGVGDGPCPDETSQGGPVAQIADFVPSAFAPTMVRGGALSADPTADPAYAGLVVPLDVPSAGRVTVGVDGYGWCHPGLLRDGDRASVNIAVADGAGNGYIAHLIAVGHDDGPPTGRLDIVRDDAGTATVLVSVGLDALPCVGRWSLSWDGEGAYWACHDGIEIAAVNDSTHDPAGFVGVGLPMWQDAPAMAPRVAWLAVTEGADLDPGTLGLHRVDPLAGGWVRA